MATYSNDFRRDGTPTLQESRIMRIDETTRLAFREIDRERREKRERTERLRALRLARD